MNPSPLGQPLRRFYFRTIVGILVPIIVVCYLIIIWRIYLAPLDSDSPVAFGPPGAKWVFYSWFIAGIIGLSLSLYGLAGAEAGMLMERTWKVDDATPLKWVMQVRKVHNQRSKLPSRLWFILALPSLVVFMAWPLSGLCLEMTSGFLHGKPGQGANVTGFVYYNFNANPGGRRLSRGSYIDAHVLGHGAVYAPQGFNRSQSEFLQKIPVVLPNTEGVKEIFLTAQGETPIEGKAWGLLLQYDCKVVAELSDLDLLKERRSSMDYISYRLNDNQTFVEISKEPRGSLKGVWDSDNLKWSLNLDAVIETAYESWPLQTPSEQEPPCGFLNEFENPPTSYCYHNMHGNTTEEYPGIGQTKKFENMTAIGVSCHSSSSVGSADIDGLRSTYSNFEQSDTPIPARRDDCAKRFGAETLVCTLDISKDGWLKWLFDSIGLPSPLDASAREGDVIGNMRFNAQLEYLQADNLRKVLLQAYSTYAIKLMYNDGRDFIGINGTRLKSHVPDITAFVAGTVIEPGIMPASVPIALFGLWALISSGLCLVYRFRRRCSAILDGHTVFRLGAGLQETYRAKLQRHSTIAEIEEFAALHEIPG
ncbi:hypothetical protein EJ07DRAFT_167746 [Lizonia empirigonia]|nr:hypothetical protein EJ07DRAFT_167746 [Lizonia empirigonia]